MIFWIVVVALTLVCLALILLAFRTPPTVTAPDVAVYRDQLKELDRDLARGVIAAPEAAATRAEVARRLLAADKAAQAQSRGAVGSRWLGMAIVAVVVALTAGATYGLLGAPGYGDLPLAARINEIEAQRATRAGQALAEAEVPDTIDDSRPEITEMANQLRTVLQERPDDLRGWRLAVNTESGLGDLEAAWRAQDRVIAILGDDAQAADFALLAELMILAAAGYVSPEAEQALTRTLELDPRNGSARYYLGLMYAQGGRPDLAWPIWRRLVGDSNPDAPWLPPIYGQIEAVSRAAGDPTPLDQLPSPGGASSGGPSPEAVEAMAALSMEERMEAIGGMVEGLAARLASDGGPPQDWGRLITAYGVMGRLDAASAVYEESKLVFDGDQGALDILARAADRAGLAP
ncbi:c-type cytochrome biogenesis protein CcmI [Jannaschia pagri]|uniref:C-type cytochrome biogenesis protein CcmI n=1 Tax=Jannaschia pagri TaxID=2829797 RepID=A0ABQ4NNB4_9RHOB|nr:MULTISPECIES: c-type cytochrome biogenesis protein CcmI [unclassified Jannaschia]GIT92052.1 c-type cytochrome biogenesis protein CcmI [Jannaschia sp. AI_61]GIT95886.1 c-type cytochrome biogenesis protein CcmI [Jannaschia sp. AI_62]